MMFHQSKTLYTLLCTNVALLPGPPAAAVPRVGALIVPANVPAVPSVSTVISE